MKALITLLASLMIVGACMADTPRRTQWRLEAQEARLAAIEEQIAAERTGIEQWYARELADLRLAAEREARMLLASERVLMTALLTRTGDAPLLVRRLSVYSPSDGKWFLTPADGRYVPETVAIFHRGNQETAFGFQKENEVFNGDSKTVKRLFDAMEQRYFLERMTGLLLDENFRRQLNRIVDRDEVKDYNSNLLRSEARRLIGTMDRLDREAQYIEKARAGKIAALEAKADGLRGDVHRVMQEIRTQPAAAQIGKVAAICMVGDSSFCMIEGVDGLVQQGAKVGGNVTVVEIAENKVTFRKVGATWEQKVGQTPAVQWK